MSFDNLPHELHSFKQWVVWKFEPNDSGKKPRKVPYSPINAKPASVSNPHSWGTWRDALEACPQGFDGIGFVLTEDDPYCFIDLDRDGSQSQDELELQQHIYSTIDSYAELSPSWKGLHILCRGSVPTPVKRSFIEIYCKSRYFCMTGAVMKPRPILEADTIIRNLWERYTTKFEKTQQLPQAAEQYNDAVIWEMARSADNGEKFNDLWYGKWQSYYPSQSEADLSLINILAFYTKNIDQIIRLFRASSLGKRDKANRDDYLLPMVKKAFDQDIPLIDFSNLTPNFEQVNTAKNVIPEKYQRIYQSQSDIQREQLYACPPGLLGKIATWIFNSSVRPVPEISLAGAIACLAGIAGRQYNVSNTGLNHYVLLLAPTGTGKEAMATGIERLFSAVRNTLPMIDEYLGPGELASGQALVKYIATKSSCFLSIIGEFGIRLQAICNPRALGAEAMLRKVLLDLFNKSGHGQVLRPTAYSESEKNIPSVNSPAFSLLGESTPERFYQAIDEGMISEGLLPRFMLIEYNGNRPPINPDHDSILPPQDLKDEIMQLATCAMQLAKANMVVNVETERFAQERLNTFNIECDGRINNAKSDMYRQLWNRAHLKCIKLAALVAVGVNPFKPVITADFVDWAEKIIRQDVMNLIDKFEKGIIGNRLNFENEQLERFREEIERYIRCNFRTVGASGVTELMHQNKVISYNYLQRRLSSAKCFREDRLGPTNAIKRTIGNMIELGDIQEVNKNQALTSFGVRSKLFHVCGSFAVAPSQNGDS